MDRRGYLAALSAAGTALAGCLGGPGAEVDTETPTATAPAGTRTATDRPTGTPTGRTSGTPTATPSPTEDAGSGAAVEVVVGANAEYRFAPASFTVGAGETVRWVWETGGHNVVASDVPEGADWTGTPGGDAETYDTGYVHERAFAVAGSYEYYCAPHRSFGMTGSFTVE